MSTCKHCGGDQEQRNPSGRCDHLHWPENLTAEAKFDNGIAPDPPRQFVNASTEFIIGGLRFAPGHYAIQRVGPPDKFDPPF